MENKETPSDAIAYAIEMIWLGSLGDRYHHSDSNSKYGKPGAVIEHMPKHMRDKLKDLTADDVNKLRFDLYYFNSEFENKKKLSEMLMDFDRKLNNDRD